MQDRDFIDIEKWIQGKKKNYIKVLALEHRVDDRVIGLELDF